MIANAGREEHRGKVEENGAVRRGGGPVFRRVSGPTPGQREMPWGHVSSRAVLLERVLPLAILVVAVVAVPVLVLSPTGLARLTSLRQERSRADEEISKLSQQIGELRAQVTRIKDDPAAVERVARDELGLIRQTEVVFQFKE